MRRELNALAAATREDITPLLVIHEAETALQLWHAWRAKNVPSASPSNS
jgi:hypothetical protein